ncbi:MAG: siphovirus Gp157 family protein [Nitrospirae bacterium]|nr:siphovirus Gp157 family protein [Nitrospirota bacterium]
MNGWKRELVTTVMDRAGIKKIAESDFTASLRQTPRPLVISDDREIPETYWKMQDPKLDRNKLIADLKSDATIPGACLGNGGVTVSVRVQ